MTDAMDTTHINPLVIRCKNCGGEVGFDIAKQQYVCTHCGTAVEPDTRKAELSHWRSTHQQELRQQLSQAKLFRCPACGAQTMTSSEEATASCPFCDNTLIDDTFAGAELPEAIIPFKVTLDEAKDKLRKWIDSHRKHPVAKAIVQHIDNLIGCYLPFQIVRGSFDGKLYLMKKGASETEHLFKAHLNSIAVNASKEFDNLFLDGIEPYDFNEARTFDFSYLNGQKAKIQNLDAQAMTLRITEEVEVELIRTLSKKLFNKRMTLYLLDDDNEAAYALLPVYFVDCGNGVTASVNGQTGKVAIATGREVKLLKLWWLAPALFTVAAVVLGIVSKDFRFYMIAFAFLAATLLGAIGTQFKKKKVKETLTSPKDKKAHNGTQVQFFEFKEDPWNHRDDKKKPVSRLSVLLTHLFS
jgi:DNA-directed RNA polymerase subunit RPC12/RpoP